MFIKLSINLTDGCGASAMRESGREMAECWKRGAECGRQRGRQICKGQTTRTTTTSATTRTMHCNNGRINFLCGEPESVLLVRLSVFGCLCVCLREKWLPFPTIRKWNYVAQDMCNNSKTNPKFKAPITRGQFGRFGAPLSVSPSLRSPQSPVPFLQIYANG